MFVLLLIFYLIQTALQNSVCTICMQYSIQAGVESKATHSVRVPVKNLRAADPALDVSMLQQALGYEFLR